MAEIDYQMALLLQHQFQQELKKVKEYDSDRQLAETLQQQFQTENEIETPKNGLVYKNTTKTKNSIVSSQCLTDPSWEVIDPTPDIHVLFMSFNDRFFWGKLLAVCVSWSKRMTSCAGICSYQGRGGLCSIVLSEPLLKLRPRKDLVETLLHEMIHAYLFVTHNNRDRDGHGPEFHKHMFRINKEAGTNITVYHDFHDEVRLYQQYWWRCNGVCRNCKPYYGMVRRATNRAPGPNDSWWAEHTQTCGGEFIKVKEPEKLAKKSSVKENVKPKEDIRKYVSTNSSATAGKTATSNIHTISNSNDNNKKINAVIPKASNIFGFTNLTTNKNTGTGVKNSSNTIVINKKPSTVTKTNAKTISKTVKNETITSTSTETIDTGDYTIVRNHWTNKFPSTSGTKRPATTESQVKSQKPPKLCKSNSVPQAESVVNCPVCLEQIPLTEFNEHLDECLEKPKTKECIICAQQVVVAEYEMHVMNCSDKNFDDNKKHCTVCEKIFSATEFDAHVEKCLLQFYDGIEDIFCDKDKRVDCLTCGKSILKGDLSTHLDNCMGLSQVFSESSFIDEDKESFDDKKFDCPFCMVSMPESKMGAHIDLCLSTKSSSFEDELNKSALIESLADDWF